jgi:tRNA1(Val) A37 N6-methylase TrmN6
VALDATAGNGHDTLFLARSVGPEGEVHALDVQAPAITATHKRLEAAGVANRVRLHQVGHEALPDPIPAAERGRLRAVMFNLGYLPAGDKTLITRGTTTLPALAAAGALLAPGGRLTVVAYPGHPGGAEETEAVVGWVRDGLPQALRCREMDAPEATGRAPRLAVLERVPASV